MKILFIASIQGKEGHTSDYESIVKYLEDTGNEVYADHVLKYSQSDLDSWSNDKKVEFHKKLFDLIKKCDVVVSEVSYQSVSVGYLISLAIDFGKPTILLHRGDHTPNLLSTLASSDKLQIVRYDKVEELKKELVEYIDYASGQADVRFNFFISPQIGLYLDWVSKKKRIPRAVFLRRLIENEMREDKEYDKE